MLPQFDFTLYPSQFFWLLISFSIILCGFLFLVLPKYKIILEERIHKIKNEVDTAVYLQKEVIKLKKERLQRISQAEEDARTEIEEAYKKINLLQIEQLKQAKKNHEEMIQKLEKSIENQRKNILDNIQPFIKNSADEIIEKLKEVEKGDKRVAS